MYYIDDSPKSTKLKLSMRYKKVLPLCNMYRLLHAIKLSLFKHLSIHNAFMFIKKSFKIYVT